jgi:hypothetical protein
MQLEHRLVRLLRSPGYSFLLPEYFHPVVPEKPLTIITGRGKHSVNGVSVLKPTVKNALIQDNWIVGTWDGGLTVRGKAAP